MERISNKLIKYGGIWETNVFTLTTDILITDAEINVVAGVNTRPFLTDDLISIEILGIRFICTYVSATKLHIESSGTRTATILSASEIITYNHLVSFAPEDLVTRFEINHLSKFIDSSPRIRTFQITNAIAGDYILTSIDNYDSNSLVKFELIELIDGKYEQSDVNYHIINDTLTWNSLTSIPSAIGIITIL